MAKEGDPLVCRLLNHGKHIFDAKKQKAASKKKQKRQQIKEIKFRPVTEKNDYEIKVNKIKSFKDSLIKSVGLFRSEFLYIEESTEPKLDSLINSNNLLNEKLEKTIVYRTLDIGGDKQVDYLNLPQEENPFLGVRGVRLTLENSQLFETQISSILNSNISGKVKIMFPIVPHRPVHSRLSRPQLHRLNPCHALIQLKRLHCLGQVLKQN